MHHLPRQVIYGLLTAGLFAAPVTLAEVSHGLYCTPTINNSPQATYTKNGIKNISTTNSLVVDCAAPWLNGQTGHQTDVVVTVYDRTATANDLCCTARLQDNAGNIIAQSSGCAATFGSNAQSIHTVLAGQGMMNVECTIPRSDASNGPSYVSSINYNLAL